jgi:hypothetical protein
MKWSDIDRVKTAEGEGNSDFFPIQRERQMKV